MSIADEVSEDRMIALRKRAEIDSKYLVVFDVVFDQNDPSEIGQSLNRYGDSFVESTQWVLFSSFRKMTSSHLLNIVKIGKHFCRIIKCILSGGRPQD